MDGQSWSQVEDPALESDAGRSVEAATRLPPEVIVIANSDRDVEVLRGRNGGSDWSSSRPFDLHDTTGRSVAQGKEGVLIGGCTIDPDGEVPPRAMVASGGSPAGPYRVDILGPEKSKSCVESIDALPRGPLAAGVADSKPAAWEWTGHDSWQVVGLPGAERLHSGSAVGVAHIQGADLIVGHGASNAGPLGLPGASSALFWTRASS